VILGFAAIVIVIVLANYFLNFPSVRSSDQAVWGQFGDYFGGVLNPILSFFALIAVLLSLRSQGKEVDAARKEASAAIAMQIEQTKVFQQQSFESAFFGLIQLHLKNLERVKAPVGVDARGTVFELISFKFNLDRVDDGIDPIAINPPGSIESNRLKVSIYCDNFMSEYGRKIAYYFATLEEIIKYIDSASRPKSVEPNQYVSIFKSLLSPEEIECLVMYAVSKRGKNVRQFLVQHKLCELMPRRARLGLAEQLISE
jgi:hypothetical protein